MLTQAYDGDGELKEMALIAGQMAAFFNKGVMSQQQANPSDEKNACFDATANTNVGIINMSDFTQYAGAGGY